MTRKAKTHISIQQALPYVLLVVGIIGGIASFALMYDKLQVLQNPAYRPSCNINPILSCGSVMKTEQANLLGVPNTVFGLMGFSALTALAIALLAGARFRKWLWRLINLGALAGFVFAVYLSFEGVYRINAICPFCFVVWMIIPPFLWYTTMYNLDEGNLRPKFLPAWLTQFVRRHHGDFLALWYVIVFAALLTHFWYYWKTLV